VTDAISWGTILPAVRAWVADGSGLDPSKCILARTGAGRPTPPHIEIDCDDVRSVAHDWSTREANQLVFAPQVVTLVDPATDRLTIIGHALELGDGAVHISTGGVAPGGLAIDTDYWVVVVDANHVQLAETFLDAMATPPVVIDITSAGSGGLSVITTTVAERVGEEVNHIVQGIREMNVTLTCFGEKGTDVTPMRILTNVLAVIPFHVEDLNNAGFGVSDLGAGFAQGVVQSIPGSRGGILEPRARVQITGYVSSSLTRLDNYIATVEATVHAQSETGVDLATTPVVFQLEQGDA